jgi:pimeloyl-ACP methyl ester carboxylesterase
MTRKLSSGPGVSLTRQSGNLALLVSCIALFNGCVIQPTTGPRSEAQSSLAEARKMRSDPKIAAGYYLDAADAALQFMNSASASTAENSRLAYNRSCGELTVLLQSNPALWNRTEGFQSPNRAYRLHFAPGSRLVGIWAPDYFNFFRIPKQQPEKSRVQTQRRDACGGALVGVYKSADPRKYFLPRVGLAVPVTAAIDIDRRSSSKGAREATLALYDPNKREAVQLAGAKRPLDADFAAPIAYYPNPGLLLGLAAMIQPGKYHERAGLYLLEPYDPDQIPVIFIHGLLSIPPMWVPTINAVRSDPELRGRFQFWVFAYPTGDPIALSALQLRESLARIYQLYPRTKGMILIGHSMGGLLSQMQVVNTRRLLWDAAFQKNADRLYTTVPPDSLIKKALIFDANPNIKRIVFICVPHRGSYLATSWIGSIAVGLIRLPGTILSDIEETAAGSLLQNMRLRHLPTGINGLSPRSPMLQALDPLPLTVPYHSIIGDRGRGDTPNSSDGIVPYWSSHMEGAQSELIVPGPHGSYALPETVVELKRILRLELETRDETAREADFVKASSAKAAKIRPHAQSAINR